jgi:hypothetical protein
VKELLIKECIPVSAFAERKDTTKQTVLNNTQGENPKLDSIYHFNILFIIDNKKSQQWTPAIAKRPRGTTVKFKLVK